MVQIQLATTIYSLKETQRSLLQLQDIAKGLELAIGALDEIAVHPQCPYTKDDVNQRANMSRNTIRKQLERAIASQKEYEEENKEQALAAMERRQAQLRRREEERQEALEKERAKVAKLRQDKVEIAIRDKELAEQRARAAAEMTLDSETGTQIERKRKAPKTKGERRLKHQSGKKGDADSEDAEDEPVSKKRRLTKKESTKYESAEIVVDSDNDSVLQQNDLELEKQGSLLSDTDSIEEHDSSTLR